MNTKAAALLHSVLASKSPVRIKLLGDSITHGVGGTGFAQNGEHIITKYARNPDGYCWAKQFKELLETNYTCSVINNGCSGTGVLFTVDNFEQLVDAEDDLILCTIGTNNRHQAMSSGPKRTPQEQADRFYGFLLQLHDKLLAAGKPVIFMANIPASRENEQDGKDYWRIIHMNDIRDLYHKAAAERGFPLISMYDRFMEYCEENNVTVDELLSDGLHPNDRGYDVMFALLKKELGL